MPRQLQANSNLDVGLEGPSAAVGEFEDHAADGAALAVLHVPLDVQLQLLGLGHLKNDTWFRFLPSRDMVTHSATNQT